MRLGPPTFYDVWGVLGNGDWREGCWLLSQSGAAVEELPGKG